MFFLKSTNALWRLLVCLQHDDDHEYYKQLLFESSEGWQRQAPAAATVAHGAGDPALAEAVASAPANDVLARYGYSVHYRGLTSREFDRFMTELSALLHIQRSKTKQQRKEERKRELEQEGQKGG
jgi:hypothetical protein